MSSSILSHLALRFASHPENVATEALAYILSCSQTARSALSAMLRQFCVQSGSHELLYQTQAGGDDGSRPDLTGRDSTGQMRLLLEAKFWAGLTDSQPVRYFEALPTPGILLFVAPEQRANVLWGELTHRMRSAGLLQNQSETELVRLVRSNGRTLALTSWRVLLGNLLAAAENAGEVATSADIRQLAALCDRMDHDAFIPLSSEEMNPDIGRRVVQFGTLASSLTDLLVASGDASVKGLRSASGNGWYGRYLYLRGYGSQIYFSGDAWAAWGISPIWIMVKNANWEVDPVIPVALQAAAIEFRIDEDGTHVPVRIQTGVEFDAITRDGLQQLRKVANALPVLPQ